MLRKKSLSQFSQTQSLHVNWDACLQRSSKLVWLTKMPILPMPTDDCFYKTLTAAVPLFHLHSIFPGQAITGLPPTNQFPWDYDVWRGRIKICFIWPHSRAAPPPPPRCYSLRRDEWWGGGMCYELRLSSVLIIFNELAHTQPHLLLQPLRICVPHRTLANTLH